MSDRGFIDWRPRGDTLDRLEMIKTILAKYREHLPLTMRQVFYAAVGQHGYEKTEKAYKRLLYVSAKARRAGKIDFVDIRDDGVTVREPDGFNGLPDFQLYLGQIARGYMRNRLLGQDRRIIVLCEASGMVPQMVNIAGQYGVEVRSSGGYDSVTAKFELGMNIARDGRAVTILHLGDLDPSGEDIFTNIAEDVGEFARAMCEQFDVAYDFQCDRIAVTRRQAIDMALPTAPTKATDSRAKNFEGETVQCEAIPPDVLNRIVKEEIEARLDLQAFAANLALEEAETKHIASVMSKVSFLENRA